MTGFVHIKSNCPVFCVNWGGWTGQTKPFIDSNSIILHHQVLFDLRTDIACLPLTVPPFLVIYQVSTSFCIISLIPHNFIFLFTILINHHYTITWSYSQIEKTDCGMFPHWFPSGSSISWILWNRIGYQPTVWIIEKYESQLPWHSQFPLHLSVYISSLNFNPNWYHLWHPFCVI